jgi:hypothetical protein
MQGELFVILEEALADPRMLKEPEPSPYVKTKRADKKEPAQGRRLTLRELWARSRRLGGKSESESAEIIRKIRDGRYSR